MVPNPLPDCGISEQLGRQYITNDARVKKIQENLP